MSTNDVVRIDEYRGRREHRLRQALTLLSADHDRAIISRALARALEVTDSDRSALLWIDEYGPDRIHLHSVIDLASDRPRRGYSLDLLRRAWESGVPSVLDLPDAPRWELGLPGGVRSALILALGSDGSRSWFVQIDSRSPRAPMSHDASTDLLFLGGEVASVVLHPDLDPSDLPSEGFAHDRRTRFAGWTVLRDIEGREMDEATNRRIATRFLVARIVRGLIEDGLVRDRGELSAQIENVREEVGAVPKGDREGHLWLEVLEAIESEDWPRLAGSVLRLGVTVEIQGHLSGARELHQTAYDLAVSAGAVTVAIDAAQVTGRVARAQADLRESMRWYRLAHDAAALEQDVRRLGVALDGLANTLREGDDRPGAAHLLDRVLALGEDAGDDHLVGLGNHGRAVLAKVEGDHSEAVVLGWRAVRAFHEEGPRLRALFDLADSLMELGCVRSAEDAFLIVAHRGGDLDRQILALDALGHIAALAGAPRRFLRFSKEVDRRLKEVESPRIRCQVWLYRARSLRLLGRKEKAEEFASRALAEARLHGLAAWLEGVSRELEAGGGLEDAKPDTDLPRLEEVSVGLREMREALLGAS